MPIGRFFVWTFPKSGDISLEDIMEKVKKAHYFTAAELNEGQEIPMPEDKIYRSLKLSVSADADSKFTAGKIRIVWE